MDEGGGSPVPLRPMNLGDVLDGAIRLALARWRVLAVLVTVVVVPVQVVVQLLQPGGLGQPGLLQAITDPAAEQLADTATGAGELVGFVGVALVEWVADLVLVAAIVVVLATALQGRRTPTAEALRAGARRTLALVGVLLVEALIALVVLVPAAVLIAAGVGTDSTALLVVGVITVLPTVVAALLVYALFYAAVPALMVERLRPIEALRRSWRLVWPRKWWVVGVTLLTSLLLVFLSFTFSVLAAAGPLFGGLVAGLLSVLGVVLTSLVTLPLQAAVATLVYFDGRVRQEGLDLVIDEPVPSGPDFSPPAGDGYGGARWGGLKEAGGS